MRDNRGAARIAALVLAAGAASRMDGAHKLLLPLGSRPIVAHAVAAAEASSADVVIVVLGHELKRMRGAVAGHRALVIYNHLYDDGMASSLRAGLAAAEAEAGPLAGILVAMGDQPLLTAAHLDRLLTAARAEPDAIHAATYAGTRATPVYLPSRTFDAVYQLEGDEGGRGILQRHPELVRHIALEPPEVGLDCDTPEDYARIQQAYTRGHTDEKA